MNDFEEHGQLVLGRSIICLILSHVRSQHKFTRSIRNDITTLAFNGHGSEAILFFSMWQGKVIHFPVIIWFYKHFLWDILQ